MVKQNIFHGKRDFCRSVWEQVCFFQPGASCKALVALITLIGPLAGVGASMSGEVTGLNEAFVADRTLIGPLAGVCVRECSIN